jgi:succinate-acetate transporter protein
MATDGDLSARVFLRPLGSPLPLGLAGLTTASLVLSGLDLGWVSVAQTKHVAVVLLVTALPLQLIACVFSLLARDGAAAGGMGFLAAGWAAMGVIRLISVPGSTSPALGLALVALACLVAGSATTQGLGKPLAALAIGLAAARFALTGIYELSSASGWQDASGAVGLGVTALAAYLVWALELEGAQDRAVLPTVRRGEGASAIADPAPEQLAHVEHEAGVRRQL